MSIKQEEIDSRQEIASAAFTLFSEIGYNHTSYSAIADRSGSGRPLVQYYFPKKEQLAILLIENLMASIDGVLGHRSESPLVRMLRMGQIYYAALTHANGMRFFASDVLADRAITSRIVILNANWSLPKLGIPDTSRDGTRASLQATGGIYELLYRDLIDERVQEPGRYAVENVASFLAFCGEKDYQEGLAHFQSKILPEEEAEALALQALDRVLDAKAS